MEYKVVYVHVGKCAGGSIMGALRGARIPYSELHCGDANVVLKKTLDSDEGNNLYLISVREPVERLISAFNWDRYEKMIKNETRNPCWKRIFSEFSSIEDLASALGSKSEDRKSLAEIALNSSKLHMHMGFSWYLPTEAREVLPADRTFVLRTEYLLEDFNAFLTHFYSDRNHRSVMPRDKDSTGFLQKMDIEKPLHLSSDSRQRLARALHADYEVLALLQQKGLLSGDYLAAS